MFGVFVFSEYDWIGRAGLEDGTVYLFGTEDEATDFQLACLLTAGEIERHGDSYKLSPTTATEHGADIEADDDAPRDRDAIIDLWKSGLYATEFFHCYPIGRKFTRQDVQFMLRDAKEGAK